MYDMYKKELTVIVCGLHFSNGVQLILNDKNYRSDSDNDNNNDDNDNDSEEVIVNDLVRFRALKINISSPHLISGEALQSCDEYGNTYQVLHNQSSSSSSEDRYSSSGIDFFIDPLPGLPDNVRIHPHRNSSKDGTRSYLFGIGAKSVQPFSLLWSIYQTEWLRHVVGKLIPMKYLESLVPKYGLVLVTDSKGNIIKSYHDPTGMIHSISQADIHPLTGDLWIGSHSSKLAILSKEFLPE